MTKQFNLHIYSKMYNLWKYNMNFILQELGVIYSLKYLAAKYIILHNNINYNEKNKLPVELVGYIELQQYN